MFHSFRKMVPQLLIIFFVDSIHERVHLERPMDQPTDLDQ